MDGDLKSIDIAKLCNWSVSSAERIIDKVLSIIEAQVPAYRQSRGKMLVKIVFVDETFLKIKKKTWYLLSTAACKFEGFEGYTRPRVFFSAFLSR